MPAGRVRYPAGRRRAPARARARRLDARGRGQPGADRVHRLTACEEDGHGPPRTWLAWQTRVTRPAADMAHQPPAAVHVARRRERRDGYPSSGSPKDGSSNGPAPLTTISADTAGTRLILIAWNSGVAGPFSVDEYPEDATPL